MTSHLMWSDTLPEPNQEILRASRVLDNWYNIHQKSLFGYSVKDIKTLLYKLIRKSCIMKKQISRDTYSRKLKKIVEQKQKRADSATKR